MKIRFDFFTNLSIKYKTIIMTYIIVLITSFILATYFSTTSSNFITNKIRLSNTNIVKLINSQINSLQKDVYDITTIISTNSTVANYLQRNNKNPFYHDDYGKYLPDTTLGEYILTLAVTKDFISDIILYYKDYDISPFFVVKDLSSDILPYSEFVSTDLYNNILTSKGNAYWFYYPINDASIFQQNKSNKVGLGRMIMNFNDYSKVGTLIVTFDSEALKNIYKDTVNPDNEGIVVIDQMGNVISKYGMEFYTMMQSSEQPQSNENSFFQTINDSHMLISYSKNNMNGWQIYYGVTTDSISYEISSAKRSTSLIVFLCLIISLPLLIVIGNYLTSPIKKLLQSMKRFQQGNFDERVDIKQQDEIGELSEGYNAMVYNIKDLIEQNYVLQIKEKEAELSALQAKINPHFLYNTLDTIFWKAHSNKQKDIANMVYSLSKIFRLNLNQGKDFMSVENEKELLEHYLHLQKIRLKEKLEYTLDFDPTILAYRIPKFILQPFVENAILHGFINLDYQGILSIKGTIQDDSILFIIEDNGTGIPSEDLVQLNESPNVLDGDEIINKKGYAINNVKARLKLYFNNDYTLYFSNKKDGGTRVEIKLLLNHNQ